MEGNGITHYIFTVPNYHHEFTGHNLGMNIHAWVWKRRVSGTEFLFCYMRNKYCIALFNRELCSLSIYHLFTLRLNHTRAFPRREGTRLILMKRMEKMKRRALEIWTVWWKLTSLSFLPVYSLAFIQILRPAWNIFAVVCFSRFLQLPIVAQGAELNEN